MITATNTCLLVGLRDMRNEQVWQEFCNRYCPVLVNFGRRLGLSEQDAEDAAQETLISFSKGYRDGLYDPEKGRLRTWLLAIAGNRIRDMHRRGEKNAGAGANTQLFDNLADDHSMSEAWEEEWRQAVLKACIAELRQQVEPVTLEAFELYALQGVAADEVARRLGISRNAVFLAKSRLLARLRDMQTQMEEVW
jgi:RNA polymerase sigma factor (sigma-70 family)